MTQKFFKKSATVLISLITGVTAVVLACAGGWWSVEEATNYTPELFVDTAYKPFYYTGELYYYGIVYDEAQNTRFNNQVVEDWYYWFEKKYDKKDIETLLFTTTIKTLDSLSTRTPDRFAKSSLLKGKDKKVTDFLSYLRIAKQAEEFALRRDDEWSYYYNDKPKKKRASTSQFCELVLAAYKASKDKFLKERLWFQLVRGYYFMEDYTSCIMAFENRQDAVKNTMYYRCMSYAAGALKGNYKISKSNYYYSIVYNNCDALKTAAHFSFKPQEEKDWQQTLLLCKNNDERCTLWQMLGIFYKDETRSIEEILKIDPSSPKLDLLLSRAINKIETGLFSSAISYEYANDDKQSQKALNELKAIAQVAVKNPDVSKPHQWYLALGYLQTLSGDFAAARENYSLGAKSAKDKLVAEEARLLDLINTVSELKKIDGKAENKLLTEFKWLEVADKALRKNAIQTWIKSVMAKKYRDQGDLLKAEFYRVNYAFYSKEKQLHDMQAFLEKSNKTDYEKYCESVYSLKLDDLYEFEAIDKALQDRTDEAIALMEKSPTGSAKTLLSNPFNGGIKDCHDCDHALPQKTKFTKLATLKKVKEMKDKLSADPYNNALLLGNAYYNMNFYGSSRVFYDCAVFGAEASTRDMMDSTYADRLTDMKLPVKYYSMAYNAAMTDEQKAKCQYMLAKCQRNEWYNKGNGEGDKNFEVWPGFKELKKYTATKFYKDAINECGYFKKYTGR